MAWFKRSRPLKVMFVITSMPVGGAETLLVNLVNGMDPAEFRPQICCLKAPGELGNQLLSSGFPIFSGLIRGKYDLAVLARLARLFRRESVGAVVTVGAGDKMFWGRLAARMASVPVILSALHSTGWPDGVGKLNRLLTPITDGFIAVAKPHGQYLIEQENFPAGKVFVIPNGIDTDRFRRDANSRNQWREKLRIPGSAPVLGIVAALRPEKNHQRFLRIARSVVAQLPSTHFVIVGDGPERSQIESSIHSMGLAALTRLPGTVADIPSVLSMFDVFALTSDNEASPVSIVEAMSCQLPVVAPRVGSIADLVFDGQTGYLYDSGDETTAAERIVELLRHQEICQSMGERGRDRAVAAGSLKNMIEGYEILITNLLESKLRARKPGCSGSELFREANWPRKSQVPS